MRIIRNSKFGMVLCILLILPFLSFAQDAPSKGLDERINDWFAPIANWWEAVVFFPIRFSDTLSIPFVLLLLTMGAVFFTIYFSFVNISKFGLAIKITRGKYDYLNTGARR